MAKDFLTSMKDRRSIYAISKKSNISDEAIIQLVGEAIKYVPSAFNNQSQRAVLLLGRHHDKLWDIVKETLKQIVPAEQFPATEEKVQSFQNGYASILYFDNTKITKQLMKDFELYKDKFLTWAQHANGMLQFSLWNLLEAEGFGASLQHYNPLIDEAVKKEWNLPEEWELIAQMPFGVPTAPAGPKDFAPLDERLRIFK